MLINCSLQDINYSSIVLPIIHSANFSINAKTLVGLLLKSTKKLPQGIRDKVAVMICNEKHTLIEKEINRILTENNVIVIVRKITFEKRLNEVVIQIEVSEIDYDQIIINFLPQIISLIPKKDSTEIVFKTLDLVKDEREAIVRNILSTISSEKKQELLELFLGQYNLKLCDLINGVMRKNGIIAKINEITIANEN